MENFCLWLRLPTVVTWFAPRLWRRGIQIMRAELAKLGRLTTQEKTSLVWTLSRPSGVMSQQLERPRGVAVTDQPPLPSAFQSV